MSPEENQSEAHPARLRTVQALSLVEDAVYIGLGVLLAIAAFVLLFGAFKAIFKSLAAGQWSGQVLNLLDQVLLTLLVIELLYTVQVSFREHGLLAEPFLVVALIAAIRRVLVVTAQVPELPQREDIIFRHAMIELAVLTGMIIVLVASLIAMQRHAKWKSKQT
ncbi:MAG TPA: phosphate-starvation-inducible PsiE family protein [Terriglobales bacterium]